jgi:hypothetical protein
LVSNRYNEHSNFDGGQAGRWVVIAMQKRDVNRGIGVFRVENSLIAPKMDVSRLYKGEASE